MESKKRRIDVLKLQSDNIFKKQYIYLLLLALLILWLFMYENKYIDTIDNKIYNQYSQNFSFNNDSELTHSVIIIDIDQKSIDFLGQWPWPRVVNAQLIKDIFKMHPASIGMDILFEQSDKSSISNIKKFYKEYMNVDLDIAGLPSTYYDNDKIFADALYNTHTVLAVYMKSDIENKNSEHYHLLKNPLLDKASTTYIAKSMIHNIDTLHKKTQSYGFINMTIDDDAIIRRIPLFIRYEDMVIPSFALQNLLSSDKNIKFKKENKVSILGHTFHIDSNSEALLHFYKPSWYKHISAIDILQGKVPSEVLAGKTVLVGTTLIGHNDKHLVATGDKLYGIDIHATLIENILNDQIIWQPYIFKIIYILLGLIVLYIAIKLIQKKNYYKLPLLFIFTIVLSFIISLLTFQFNIYDSIAYLWIPLLIYVTLIAFILFYIYDKEQKNFYKKLNYSHAAALESMVMVVEAKDCETASHLIRTKKYIETLAYELKKKGLYPELLSHEYIDLVSRAAPLHDIGKVGIPDMILNKAGKLNTSERKIMDTHPEIGRKILENAIKSYQENIFLTTASNIAYYHHEKWDGSGYPKSLKGKEIPLEARLMGLVDVYDALISKRCYKEAYDYEVAEKIIINDKGTHFDPEIVDAFIELKDEFRQIANKYIN